MSEPSFTAGIFAHGREVSGETFMSPMVFPYFPNTAFFIPDLTTSKAQNGTFSYVRFNNPDRTALADVVTFLEDGEDSVICSSGMGAITTTMISLLNQGDEVICNSNIYGETHQIMNYLLPKFGIRSKMVDMRDLDALTQAITPQTRMVYTEVCANPVNRMTDIRAAAEIAHKNGALLVVDNTFTTAIAVRPLELGADVVINSMTKFMNGHSDAIAGSVTGSRALMDTVRTHSILCGTACDPYAAFTMLKNFGTMELRVRRQMENAAQFAAAVEKMPHVVRVEHPSLDSFAQHELALRTFRSNQEMCGIVGVEVPEDVEKINEFMRRLKMIRYAGTLGGIHSTMMHPVSTSHKDVPDDQRRAMGITPGVLRFTVGIEDVGELIEDVRQALSAFD